MKSVKNLLLLFVAAGFLASCAGEATEETTQEETTQTETTQTETAAATDSTAVATDSTAVAADSTAATTEAAPEAPAAH